VEHFVGMSGRQDFILRYSADERRGIIKSGGRLHISMCGKLNEDASMPLMDLPALLFAVLPHLGEPPDVVFEEAEIRELRFHYGVERIEIDGEGMKVSIGNDFLSEETLARLRELSEPVYDATYEN
jgi:hypothetical protein